MICMVEGNKEAGGEGPVERKPGSWDRLCGVRAALP